MSTRGLYGLCVDGTIKASYKHFDSYPTGLGNKMGEEIAALIGAHGLDGLREKARAIALLSVDDIERPITDEERARLAPLHAGDPRLLDGTLDRVLCEGRGSLAHAVGSGLMIDNVRFAADSLFCEWAYVADLDRARLEIFKGFQTAPHGHGRFAALEPKPDRSGATRYWPVRQFLDLPFEALSDGWSSHIERLAELIFYPEDQDDEDSAQERLELIARFEPHLVGVDVGGLRRL